MPMAPTDRRRCAPNSRSARKDTVIRFRTWTSALLLLAATATTAQTPGASSLRQEMEAARRAGIPVTLREMQGALPPPERNAAVYYLRVGDILQRRRQSAPDFATISAGDLPGATRGERLRQALLRNADVRDLIHQALKCDRCVFPIGLDAGAANEARQYTPLRTAALWLRAEGFDLWARGERAEAVARVRDAFAVARHAAEARTMGGFLVACSIDALAFEAMDRMLLSKSADAAVTQAVSNAVRTGYSDPAAAECIAGDGAQQLLWAARLKREGPKAFPQLLRNVAMDSAASLTRGWKAPRNWGGFLDSAVAYSLRTTRRGMAAVRLPYPQAAREVDRLAAEVRARLARRDPSVLLAAASWSATRLPVQSVARVRARRSLTEALAAIVAWRLRRGAWPPTLSDATAHPPLDPFDLRPMRYARRKDGFALWSVGPSGRFDGARLRGTAPVGEVGLRHPASGR